MFKNVEKIVDGRDNFYFNEFVPHRGRIMERFHLESFSESTLKDLCYHFIETYPDGEMSFYEFIRYHLITRKGDIEFWKHVFHVLTEYTDKYGRYKKVIRRTTSLIGLDGVEEKPSRKRSNGFLEDLYSDDEVEEEVLKQQEEEERKNEEEDILKDTELSTRTLNFFQMLTLFFFSHLKSSKESFRFLHHFLSIPKCVLIPPTPEKLKELLEEVELQSQPQPQQEEEDSEEGEGEGDSNATEDSEEEEDSKEEEDSEEEDSEDDRDEILALTSPKIIKLEKRFLDGESRNFISAQNLSNIISLRTTSSAGDLDHRLQHVLSTTTTTTSSSSSSSSSRSRVNNKKSFTELELSQKFIEKLKKPSDTVGEDVILEENIQSGYHTQHIIERAEFKKRVLAKKDLFRFLEECIEDSVNTFLDFYPSSPPPSIFTSKTVLLLQQQKRSGRGRGGGKKQQPRQQQQKEEEEEEEEESVGSSSNNSSELFEEVIPFINIVKKKSSEMKSSELIIERIYEKEVLTFPLKHLEFRKYNHINTYSKSRPTFSSNNKKNTSSNIMNSKNIKTTTTTMNKFASSTSKLYNMNMKVGVHDSLTGKKKDEKKKSPEIELYQKGVINFPSNFKLLFRRFFGRFTFFDERRTGGIGFVMKKKKNRSWIPSYYLSFTKKRNYIFSSASKNNNNMTKMKLFKFLNCSFSSMRFSSTLVSTKRKTVLKMDKLLPEILKGLSFSSSVTEKNSFLRSVHEQLRNLLSFLELKIEKYNFDWCGLRMDVLLWTCVDNNNNLGRKEDEEEEMKYSFDLYFDDTKLMSNDRGKDILIKKIGILLKNCEKLM